MAKKPLSQEDRKRRDAATAKVVAQRSRPRVTGEVFQLTLHNKQLQRKYDALIELLRERARANDSLQAALIAQRDSRLRMFETYEGVVDQVLDDRVVVVYQVDDDLMEQTYLRNQLLDQRLPEKGTPIAVYVFVAELPREPGEASGELAAEEAAPLAKRRKNIVTLPKEF